MNTKTTALLVMARNDEPPLRPWLEAFGLEVLHVGDCKGGRDVLGVRPSIVLTDSELPDGSWQTVLGDVQRSDLLAEVVVCACVADAHFWCDVLDQGAYDLLVKPYHKEEVLRVLTNALARRTERSRALKAGATLGTRKGFVACPADS